MTPLTTVNFSEEQSEKIRLEQEDIREKVTRLKEEQELRRQAELEEVLHSLTSFLSFRW